MTCQSTDMLVPFPVRAGPGEVLPTPAWTEAMAAVHDALENGRNVLLTGAPGTGKSLLLRCLRDDLAGPSCNVLLIPGEIERSGEGATILLLDDADRIPKALLNQLRAKVDRAVLVGAPALSNRVAAGGDRVTSVTLRTLAPAEVADFVQAEVRRAGLAADVFEPAAIELLARHTGGVPAAIRTHAALALFLARLDDASRVTMAHARDALDRTGTVPLGDEPAASAPLEPAPTPAPPTIQARSSMLPLAVRPLLSPALPVPSRTWHLGKPAGLAVTGLALAALLAVVTSQLRPGPARQGPAAPQDTTVARVEPAPPAQPAARETAISIDPKLQPHAAEPPAVPPEPPPKVAQAEAAPPPAVVLARPPDQPFRVVVAVHGRAAASRGSVIVQALRDRGIIAMLDLAPARAHDPEISYFFPEDRPAAYSLARAVAGSPAARLVAPPTPLPRPGTVRLRLPATPASGDPADYAILVTSEHR